MAFVCCALAGALTGLPAWAQTHSRPASPTPPALMLAGDYRPGLPLQDYWVSEKLDGVRGRWTGRELLTRGGHPIAAPDWFTAGWPDVPLDGELWMGHGRFEATVATVRTATPVDADWRELRFMVFDLPAHPGPFSERLQALNALLPITGLPWLQAVPQQRVANVRALQSKLVEVERLGGEGLMLHRGSAHYRSGRSEDILKFKRHQDAEAQVVGHEPGRGKYAGQTGALWVQTPQGQRFKLGSGLSDAQRRQPPPVGAWVTYRYRGHHDSGLPRFATLVRERGDWALSQPHGGWPADPATTPSAAPPATLTKTPPVSPPAPQ